MEYNDIKTVLPRENTPLMVEIYDLTQLPIKRLPCNYAKFQSDKLVCIDNEVFRVGLDYARAFTIGIPRDYDLLPKNFNYLILWAYPPIIKVSEELIKETIRAYSKAFRN